MASTSDAIDEGTDIGLWYNSTAPDLGAFEYVAPGAAEATVTLQNLSSGSARKAIIAGNVIHDGGGTVSARGVTWDTSTNPDIGDDSYTASGSGTGTYSITVSGLTPSTTYYFRCYATNEAGTDVKVAYVTVLDSGLPSVSVEFIAAPRNGPAGTTVQFINLTFGAFDTFLWDFGDNSSDTTEDPSHVYNSPGLYTVSLTVFSSTSGFLDTETKVNYINISPASSSMRNPDFVATPVTGTCPFFTPPQYLSPGYRSKPPLSIEFF